MLWVDTSLSDPWTLVVRQAEQSEPRAEAGSSPDALVAAGTESGTAEAVRCPSVKSPSSGLGYWVNNSYMALIRKKGDQRKGQLKLRLRRRSSSRAAQAPT